MSRTLVHFESQFPPEAAKNEQAQTDAREAGSSAEWLYTACGHMLDGGLVVGNNDRGAVQCRNCIRSMRAGANS